MVPVVMMLAALGHPPAAEATVPAEAVKLEGEIREVGGGPRARALLVTEDGRELVLHAHGAVDHSELLRLSGVKVAVQGVMGDPRLPKPKEKHVLVDGYAIVDVGRGVVPELGSIAALEVDGERRLLFVSEDGRAAFLPKGWSRKMKGHVGSKVWMVGERDGSRYRPKRFAILKTKTDAGEDR